MLSLSEATQEILNRAETVSGAKQVKIVSCTKDIYERVRVRKKIDHKKQTAESRRTIKKYFKNELDDKLKDATECEINTVAYLAEHTVKGRYKQHPLKRTYSEWDDVKIYENGYTSRVHRIIEVPVCPQHNKRLHLNISQEELGCRLGYSRPTINKTIKRLIKKGIIEGYDYNHRTMHLHTDNTIALAFTKKYYSMLNRWWFSRDRAIAAKRAGRTVEKSGEKCPNADHGLTPGRDISSERTNLKINQENLDPADQFSANFSSKKRNLIHVRDMHNELCTQLGGKLSPEERKLTPWRAKMLGQARNDYFPTMEAWRRFLRMVASCWKLMCDGFRLSVEWLLKFSTIRRILQGGFGIAKTARQIGCDDFVKEGTALVNKVESALTKLHFDALDSIDACCEPERLRKLRHALLSKYRATAYMRDFAHREMRIRDNVVEILRIQDCHSGCSLYPRYAKFFKKHGYVLTEKFI